MNLNEVTKLTEDDAREYLENIRWPQGPVCPRCGCMTVTKLQGKSTRPGVYKCKAKGCRKPFTVTVATIFERSHVDLRTWVIAFHMMCASKKGISAHQIHRMLGVTYKTAWFVCHRIRHAMANGSFDPPKKLRGTVEGDETFVGGKPRVGRKEQLPKKPVAALVERGGNVRVQVVPYVRSGNIRKFVRKNVDSDATLMTDDASAYKSVGKHQPQHHTVVHRRQEYARGEIHTQTIESFFALLKRGIYGTFHHCDEKHLQKYCDEFAFRWDHRQTTDGDRRDAALAMSEGKRLMYKDPVGRGLGSAS